MSTVHKGTEVEYFMNFVHVINTKQNVIYIWIKGKLTRWYSISFRIWKENGTVESVPLGPTTFAVRNYIMTYIVEHYFLCFRNM